MRKECPNCGSKNIRNKIEDQIDHTVCEESFWCKDCGSYVDYFSYGIYESEKEG